jgi:hypothetical protein
MGGHLILEYQKSASAHTGREAGCWVLYRRIALQKATWIPKGGPPISGTPA